MDLGGTKLEVGMADDQGKIVESLRIATGEESPEEVFEKAAAFYTGKTYEAVGVASFGPLAGHCLSKTTPKRLWRGFDLQQGLAQSGILKPEMPCEILQDVQAEVIAEAKLGNHGDFNLYAYATISTGIGVAFYDVERNYLFRGAEGGHVPVPGNPGKCESHKNCWEGTCSGTAIAAKPTGHDLEPTTQWLLQMATAIYTIHLTTNTDCFILGGGVIDGLGQNQQKTLQQIQQAMTQINHNYIQLPALRISQVKSRALAGMATWLQMRTTR